MAPGPIPTPFPTHVGPPRIRMRPAATSPGVPDGAWWPRSGDLSVQLSALLGALWDRLGGVERVVYDTATWSRAAARLAVHGRVVRLDGFRTPTPDRIELVGVRTGRVLTLVVVPPDTAPQDAELALATAALSPGSGVSSRFIGSAGEQRDAAEPGRSGHEVGESFRARAAEERHTAVERNRAVRTIATHAVDAQDCRTLLSILGLDAADGTGS
jgi:uncharacterized protein DUF5994